ncbi:MAG TPA: DedA family protein [Candidatus Acidoferrales bacterium]|nr:DedA family protein [Candidatus Acidoferrales bacterium]
MDLIHQAIDIFLHLDVNLNILALKLGPLLYGLLFVIIFSETGLVILPFLPGDSLLFAVGALAAVENSAIGLPLAGGVLTVAAVLGDATNYAIGARVGPAVFTREDSRWLNKRHLLRTHEFYEEYGGKTIILARFMPIIRTFAPFVAGIGKMGYGRFAAYNVVGGVAWVLSFILAGYFFGNVPVVKRNFHLVIIAIIVISTLPPVIEYLRQRKR